MIIELYSSFCIDSKSNRRDRLGDQNTNGCSRVRRGIRHWYSSFDAIDDRYDDDHHRTEYRRSSISVDNSTVTNRLWQCNPMNSIYRYQWSRRWHPHAFAHSRSRWRTVDGYAHRIERTDQTSSWNVYGHPPVSMTSSDTTPARSLRVERD